MFGADINVEELELEDLREFYKSVSHYAGGYPAWKVLQEYRQLILSLNPGSDNQCLYHFHNLDAYLNRLVDSVNLLRRHQLHPRFHLDAYGWDDQLPRFKGDDLLDKISLRHPNFKIYMDQQ